MRTRNRTINILLAALLVTGISACGKNEQEASKFPRTDTPEPGTPREIPDQISYQLDNGITVFLQEDHTDRRVAVETVYRAGFVQEPSGQVQVSHITEHAVIFSATKSYKAGESAAQIQKFGMVNAEAVGDFVHFDYIVMAKDLPEVIKVEAERLTSLQFDQKTLGEQAQKAAGEIKNVMSSDRGTLTKFGFMTLLQAINHGQTDVPIEAGNYQRTVEEVSRFHDEYYRVNDMILSIVGNFNADEIKPLVEQYFGSIPPKPAPQAFTTSISKDLKVDWDINASVFFIVCPGPYADYKERLILTMFGSYLSGYLSRNTELFDLTRATYASNQGYHVGDLPFFVFAQPAPYKSVADVGSTINRLFDEAINSVDANMFDRIKGTTRNYVTASLLTAAPNPQVDYHFVLGQHALNLALKYMLKEGRSDDDFIQLLDSITIEDMKATLTKYLGAKNRFDVTISGN